MSKSLYELPSFEFHDYRKKQPPVAGLYVWRVDHKFIQGVTLIFLAKYRERGAGYEKVISPEFDYWDGYRVVLPKGSIEWSEYNGKPSDYGKDLLEVAGIDNAICPFCKNKPYWRYAGRYIGSGPTDTDYFYLECCQWFSGFSSRMRNPLELAKNRNAALAGVEVSS